jgi:hypothetical protein
VDTGADTDPLPGLPGASDDPGTGTVVATLFEGLLTDAGSLAAHREHRRAWYGDLVGPLVVPATAVADLQEQLAAADHGLAVLLVGDLDGLREARDRLLDDDRVELVGVELVGRQLAGAQLGGGAEATAGVLAALDFSAPAWLGLPLGQGWEEALDAVADDGAEFVAVRADEPTDVLAAFVRRAVDLDVSFRLVGDGAADRWIAVLCAVRAALNGAETPEVRTVLAEQRPAPLVSALRRMSDADAAVARAFLAGVTVDDVRACVDDLVAQGLVDPDEER